MARIHDLLTKVSDPVLRESLEHEVKALEKNKKFGLVFEDHLPEATPIYDFPIRRGTAVALKDSDFKDVWHVQKLNGDTVTCVQKDEAMESGVVTRDFAKSDLVAVATFGEPIYPYLEKIDEIEHGGGDLWHTLIQADNYHALQLLEYLYAGKVDCIYIDPPYNTGAKDWKYNNDYVDGNDAWRHSKWLSMMEKRLKIAKRLLNPKDSVLIVTIDEKEYLHLGMLLEQMFPEARIQMVSDVINRTGSVRQNMFARADEYIFIVLFGEASAQFTQNDMLNPVEEKKGVFQHLIRGGANGKRDRRPNLFYPIYFSKHNGRFVSVGNSLPKGIDRKSVGTPDGCFCVWPLMQNGTECTWGCSPEKFVEKLEKGYISFGRWSPGDESRWIGFLQSGTETAVETGLIEVLGRDADGGLILGRSLKPTRALTVWNQVSHDAGAYGSTMLNLFFPDRRFSYPKSLYAVHDAIRFFVANKPNALILDFFAGSGTTLHAVNLLNAEDGGKRRCILVTNNEVSNDEAAAFRKKRLKPGDAEWEAKGIARYVTWPRTTCSIKGENVKGEPLKGDYLGGDKEHPRKMADGFSANAVFFKLGFLDPNAVSLGRRMKELLPVLWMKAGAIGPCPDTVSTSDGYAVLEDNRMAVLFDEVQFSAFKKAVRAAKGVETVYLVCDYEPSYRAMMKAFPGKAVYPLYRDYLDSFRLNVARG